MPLSTLPVPSFALTATGFSLGDTLDCGQCFRFDKQPDGSFAGVAGNHFAVISQQGDRLIFSGTPKEDEGFWRAYLDLDADYASYQAAFSKDPVLKEACRYAGGIRLVRQDPWEALCSFIISQNNNIPRIKGIIARLCALKGPALGEDRHGFPAPNRLAACSLEELSPLRAGFRAGYLLDAAQKVVSGTVDLSSLFTLPMEEAREQLRQIRGVGPKVAECALLYGFHRLEAFPVDVWINRALRSFYPQGFPFEDSPVKGVAQQYLFHYIRTCPDALPKELRHA